MTAFPRRWHVQEIEADVASATALFRSKRIAEPLEAWLREVDQRTAEFQRLFDEHGVALPQRLTAEDVPRMVEAGLLDALRYLTGPPVSADDLKQLADVDTLSPQKLRADPEAAQRVLDTIRQTIDPRRFTWLAAGRGPTESETSVAIFASALLHAAQRAQTVRRTLAKDEQEAAVREELRMHQLTGRRLPPITNHAQFPERGVFSESEVQFGPERADVLARLWDDRMLPLECKVSNSKVNSYKRLNHDTLAKHTAWKNAFGTANVVPSAVLAGVFSATNVIAAQEAGLGIFWSHRLDDLGDFVDATRA